MVVFRVLGWLLLAMAVAAVVHDGLAWWAEGSFHLLGFGDLWSHLDARSLAYFQGAVQRHLSAVLWTWMAWPLLRVPVLPVFLVVGLVCLFVGGFLCRGVSTLFEWLGFGRLPLHFWYGMGFLYFLQ